MKRTLKIMNHTKFKTSDIEEISLGLLAGQLAPSFYLICVNDNFNGLALTNLDKPTMIIRIEDLGQFAETFVHKLIHLQQHQEGYADEDEAYAREIIISK
ncbi:MAG: hypothetical protein ACFFDN_01310 [Candidatus Hodarchaeota archaeon]